MTDIERIELAVRRTRQGMSRYKGPEPVLAMLDALIEELVRLAKDKKG